MEIMQSNRRLKRRLLNRRFSFKLFSSRRAPVKTFCISPEQGTAEIERAELQETIQDYHRHFTPLTVPLTLIKHYVRVLAVPYLIDQVYLNPHPKELTLRNHV